MTNKILSKAMEINQFEQDLPAVEIGEEVRLNDIWDGNGDVPESSSSFLLTHNGEDGKSNYDMWINYSFTVVEENEDDLETIVKIEKIELI